MKKSSNKNKKVDGEFIDHEMSLSKTKKIIGYVALVLVLVLLGVFFGKTAIWEYYYYNEMEGSERAAATTVEEEEEELDESEVTETMRAEYTVPADQPRYLSIEKLGIRNARVLSVGLKSSGELSTPVGIFDVGWYNASGKPGAGKPILMDGHNGGPNVVGVFKYLNQLYKGDLITLERGDGAVFTYKVVENNTISLDEADSYMSTAMTSPVPGTESLTLITCTGEWSQTRRTYLSRQFVRAVIVE